MADDKNHIILVPEGEQHSSARSLSMLLQKKEQPETTVEVPLAASNPAQKDNKSDFAIILISFVILLLLFYNGWLKASQLAPGSPGHKIKITFSSAELEYNNSVGNDWNTRLLINDTELHPGQSIILDTNGLYGIEMIAIATEADSIPDTGRDIERVNISDMDLSNKMDYEMNVKVRENRGRYSGNAAGWKFKIDIKRYISLSDVIESLLGTHESK